MNAAAKTAKPSALTAAFISTLSHPRLSTPATEQDVQARLFALGFKDACGRCCGTGSYGPLSVLGGKCFKCNGRSYVGVRLTWDLLNRVRAEVSAEILNAYADRLIECKRAKALAAGAEKRVREGYSRTLFMQHFYGLDSNGGRNREAAPFSWLAYAIHANEKAPTEALTVCVVRLSRGECAADDVLAAEAAVVRARRVQDLAFSAAMSSGEIEADQRKVAEMKAAGASYDEEEAARRAAWKRADELLSLAGMALGE